MNKKNNNERIDDLQFENLKIIQNKDNFCFRYRQCYII